MRGATIFGLVVMTIGVLLASPVPLVRLEGVVLEDHTGKPLARAEVRVWRLFPAPSPVYLETDAEGRFRVPELPPAEYRIVASKPNYVDAIADVRLTGDHSSSLLATLRLIRRGAVSGRVTDIEDRPVSGATVVAMPRLPGRRSPRLIASSGYLGRVDAHGQYRIYNLPPGEYVIAASYGASPHAVGSAGKPLTDAKFGSGYLFYPSNAQPEVFSFFGGEEYDHIDFRVAVTTLCSVSGRVELPEAHAIFWLALTPVDQPEVAIAVAQTEPGGAFRLAGIPPGSYHLFASGPLTGRGLHGAMLGEPPLFARTIIDIAGQHREDITLSPAPGRLVTFNLRPADSHTSRCPPTAQIALFPLEDWGASLERRVSAPISVPVTIPGLAPARYLVSATALEEACYSQDRILDLDQESGRNSVELPLMAPGSVRGRLFTGNEPASNFAVTLFPVDSTGGTETILVAFPDSQGQFRFPAVRPGLYRIAAAPTSQSQSLRDVRKTIQIDVPAGSATDIDLPVLTGGDPRR